MISFATSLNSAAGQELTKAEYDLLREVTPASAGDVASPYLFDELTFHGSSRDAESQLGAVWSKMVTFAEVSRTMNLSCVSDVNIAASCQKKKRYIH